MHRMCMKQGGIEVINIVRRDEHVHILKKELQAKHVLNQTSPDFLEQLKGLVAEL